MALRCLGTHTAISYLVAAHVNPEHFAELKAPARQLVLEQYNDCVRACAGGDELLVALPELRLE